MNEPLTVVAGNTYTWYETNATYPPTSYTLQYYLNGPVTASFTGSQNGTDTETYVINVSSSLTTTLTAGTYTLVGFLTQTGKRYSYSTSIVTVLANPATTAAGTDARSHARRTLDLIKSAVESIATDGVVSLSIAGRSRTNYTMADLLKLKSYYEAEVKNEEAQERINNGKSGKSQIYIRFQ